MKRFSNRLLTAMMLATMTSTSWAQQERLNRGLVAVKKGSTTFVSWRVLNSDGADVCFDLLRDGNVVEQGLTVSNATVTGGQDNSRYQVVVRNGDETLETTDTVTRWGDIYTTLRLDRPASQPDCHYFPNDCSVADLDGDGQYELVIKWDPSNNQDNSNSGKTGNVYLDAYKMVPGETKDGQVVNCTRLWRIDLGQNIRAGAHYTQFLVYDFDGDGRAELVCKTAQGSMDGQGNYVNKAASDNKIKSASNSLRYANDQGRILSGAEYLTVFEGTTGRALHTVWYNPNRGCTTGEVKAPSATELNNLWGDNYGNRCDRFLACVAHLDGTDRPASAVMCRGYYTRAYLWAVDFDGEQLTTRWLHASVSPTQVEVTDRSGKQTTTYDSNTSGIGTNYTAYGQGCHSVAVGDVDGDGCDEIIFGSAAIDNDGSLLHTTGLGHGDALHLSDLMPDRPGLEVMMVHEEEPYGWSVRDAMTGQLLIHHTGSEDTGRGIAADIFKEHRGFEYWHSDDYNTNQNIYSSNDEVVGHYTKNYPFYNFRIYWDGTPQDNLFDKGALNDGNWSRLLSCGNYGNSVTYGSKANPLLIADILGDWREEIIMFDKTDSTTVNIFTTTKATKLRVPTLMQDHIYRMSVAWQNVGYNQPPHLGYYLPDAMMPHIHNKVKAFEAVVNEPLEEQVLKTIYTTVVDQNSYMTEDGTVKRGLPKGISLDVDFSNNSLILSGTPTEVGDYRLIIELIGRNGEEATDTISLHVSATADGIAQIEKDGKEKGCYDLQGRRISHTASDTRHSDLHKGIYITNGRKRVIR